MPVVAFIFVLETITVIIQTIAYKVSGYGYFMMAPLHHHLEIMGMTENKVVARFSIVSVFAFIISVAMLFVR